MVPQTVFVVENDQIIREIVAHYLQADGYRVDTAPTAGAALIRLLSHVRPDLVIAGVNTGAMTGIELCVRLKGDPRFRLTPVIVVTELFDQHAGNTGLVAGADCFLTKPLDYLELQTRVKALLRVKVVLDRLERSEVEPPSTAGYQDLYSLFLAPAIGLAVLELLVARGLLMKLP